MNRASLTTIAFSPDYFVTCRDDVAVRIENETKEKIEEMNRNVSANKDKVIQEILQRIICDVKPELHRNLRLG